MFEGITTRKILPFWVSDGPPLPNDDQKWGCHDNQLSSEEGLGVRAAKVAQKLPI